MPIPFGDDITGIRLENGKIAILKTDMLIAATDVPPGMTPFQAARKAVVMNISDLASKGVEPNTLFCGLEDIRAVLEERLRENRKMRDAAINAIGTGYYI